MATDPADVYRLFFEPGEVTEIRAYGLSGSNKKAWQGFARGAGIVYGYFDNADAFGKCAMLLDQAKAPGIYFVLNPVRPALLARSANRLKAADQKTSTTSDKDVLCLRWVYLDLDPKAKNEDGTYNKVSNISSTADELGRALDLRNRISKWLKEEGFEQAIPGCSGNGAHLLMRMPDLPNAQESVDLVRSILRAIEDKFGDAGVEIDQVVHNPARICKVYGTVARKGDSIKDRPHRRSYLEPQFLEVPDAHGDQGDSEGV